MRRFFLWLANQLRPFHNDGLDGALQIPHRSFSTVDREYMERMAGLSFNMPIEFGVFEQIELEYAKRASNAWRPKELILMEGISMAFYLVEVNTKSDSQTFANRRRAIWWMSDFTCIFRVQQVVRRFAIRPALGLLGRAAAGMGRELRCHFDRSRGAACISQFTCSKLLFGPRLHIQLY